MTSSPAGVWSKCSNLPVSEKFTRTRLQPADNDDHRELSPDTLDENAVKATAEAIVTPGVPVESTPDDLLSEIPETHPRHTRSVSPTTSISRSISDISFDSGSPSTLLLATPSTVNSAEHAGPCKLTPARKPCTELFFSPRDVTDSSTFPFQDAYLQFMEPGPVKPPAYHSLPPGGCPRFPAFSWNEDNEALPAYSPSVYKIGFCARKIEWYSPYLPSHSRSWKNLIIELNSTQLNFYLIPSLFEPILQDTRSSSVDLDKLPATLRSQFTTQADTTFYSLCEKLNLLPTSELQAESGNLSAALLSKFASSVNKRLVRLYSLQHAKIGIASDYTKRKNVFRLRLETEQILILFRSVTEVIEWNLGITVGKDLAFDLSDRELPLYPTVPCGRRNNIDHYALLFNDVITRKMRAQSDPNTAVGLRRRFYKLKDRLSSLSVNARNDACESSPGSLTPRTKSRCLYSISNLKRDSSEHLRIITGRNSFLGTMSNSRNAALGDLAPDDDLEDDIQNMSDLHNSDDEDDLEVSIKILDQDGAGSDNSATARFQDTADDEHKWRPVKKIESERRNLTDALRCIRPLKYDDSWLNKVLVKPTKYSPLMIAYLRESYFGHGHND